MKFLLQSLINNLFGVGRSTLAGKGSIRLLLFLLLTQPLSASAQSASIDRALAIVGNEVITLNEYQTRHRQQRLENADYPAYEGLVDADLLDIMVNERIQVSEARRRKIKVSKVEVDRAVDFVAQQNNLTTEQLVSQLESDNFTVKDFRESLKQQQLIRKLVDAVANSRVKVSDTEIENYMKSHSELITAVDEQYEVAHLLISIAGKTEQAVQSEVENMQFIRQRIVKGLAFDQAVRDFADSGQDQGGYLGWRSPNQLPELFVKALTGMDVPENSVSQILQSENGLHLLKLLDKRGGDNLVLQQKTQHILIRPERNEIPEEALERANAIYQQLVAGESFDSLARLHSQDESTASSGGDLGWVNPGQLVPEFEQAAGLLPLDTVSQPVQSRFGFHLIRVVERRNADMAREIAQNKAREVIFRRKAGDLFKSWFRSVKDRTYVEYVGS